MISLIASSGDLVSRMSLTSIRWPENANERTSSTTSCRLWISSRKKSDTCATDPETSQIATILGRSRWRRFQEVRNGTPPQAALRRSVFLRVEMAAPLPLARLAVALAQPPRDGADQGLHLLDLAAFEPRQRRVAQDFVAQVFGLLAAVQHQRLVDDLAHVFAQRLPVPPPAVRLPPGLVAVSASRSSRSRSMPSCSRIRDEKMPRWVK